MAQQIILLDYNGSEFETLWLQSLFICFHCVFEHQLLSWPTTTIKSFKCCVYMTENPSTALILIMIFIKRLDQSPL